eukprot:Phypoly_transcript_07097.p1 GENE.Phypoly_transcript_07097~~Phypoly_transcript_07097.p1  ORF type:complete len:187 (+),score=19.46 Phypoly_transcript_07097:1088-1648(+)
MFSTTYCDGTNRRYRDQFQGTSEWIWIVNFPEEYAIVYDDVNETCNTTCYRKSGTCGEDPPSTCGLFPMDFFGVESFFPNTTLVGECVGGANMWNWTFLPQMNLNYSYCVTSDNIPLTFTICDNMCGTTIFKNFQLGMPEDSLFELPSYCPCNSTSISSPKAPTPIAPTPMRRHDILSKHGKLNMW